MQGTLLPPPVAAEETVPFLRLDLTKGQALRLRIILKTYEGRIGMPWVPATGDGTLVAVLDGAFRGDSQPRSV